MQGLTRTIRDRLLEPAFGQLAPDHGWSAGIAAARARGETVVFVGRSASLVDALALDELLRRHGFPRLGFTNDPVSAAALGLGANLGAEGLRQCLVRGDSALLFMRRPEARRPLDADADILPTLVRLQREGLEVLLFPQTFVWSPRPSEAARRPLDLLLGPREFPGTIRMLAQFILHRRQAWHRAGVPLSLREATQSNPSERLVDGVAHALIRRLERERILAVGPAEKSAERVVNELMRGRRLREPLAQAARESNTTVASVELRARKELHRMVAAPDPLVLWTFEKALHIAIDRVFDGLVVDGEGVRRIREAARRGPLVLVPSHKSHLDYLIVSAVCFAHGIALPRIAAGDNLAFFPLGAVFRRSGAFFIRRSFRGDRLYPRLVDAYVRRLLADGHNLEVFIEGGRSRTGKLLAPKLGILSMVIDAAVALPDTAIQFVPISIGYERIVEESAYERELGGAEKEPESVRGLLRAPQALLARYGRLHVRFGDILDLEALRGEAGLRGDLTPSARRGLLNRIAHRVTQEIERVTPVTPSAVLATALLSQTEDTMHVDPLTIELDAYAALFALWNAPFPERTQSPHGGLHPEASRNALALFEDAGWLRRRGHVIRVPRTKRVAIEYYKNNAIHFLVAPALVATVVDALGPDASMARVRGEVRWLSRVFRHEFQLRADASPDDLFDETVARMIEHGTLAWTGDVLHAQHGTRALERLRRVLTPYVEAYAFAFERTRDRPLPPSQKQWLREAMAEGRRRREDRVESHTVAKLELALHALHDLDFVRLSGDRLTSGKLGAASDELASACTRLRSYARGRS